MQDKNSYRLHQKCKRNERKHKAFYIEFQKETKEQKIERIYSHLLDRGYTHVTNCSVEEALEFRRQGPEKGVHVALGEDAPCANGKIDPRKWAVFMKEY